MSTIWPRVPRSVGDSVLPELRGLPVAELTERVVEAHPAQIFASTGGSRAGRDDVRALRGVVVDAARTFGFPAAMSSGVLFDRALAPRLIEAMPMALAEATNRSVWDFTTLALAPDVTAWRFGFNNTERWVCSDLTRHMFSRLWWQAYLLTEEAPGGTRDCSLLNSLAESDLNQLLERTRLGGQRPLLRAFSRAVVDDGSAIPRRALIRDASARLLRRMAFVDHSALTPDELNSAVRAAVDESRARLEGAGAAGGRSADL